MLPLHHSPDRRTGQVFVCGVHARQQGNVCGSVPSRKTRPARRLALDTPGLHPATDPSRQLRSAQSAHLGEKTTHDPFLASTYTAILLRSQNPFDELIEGRFCAERPLWLTAAALLPQGIARR